MADASAEANRVTALREATINATLNHPHIVTTYTYDMQPLGDTQTSGRGFLDWQMYIIQVCRLPGLHNGLQAIGCFFRFPRISSITCRQQL